MWRTRRPSAENARQKNFTRADADAARALAACKGFLTLWKDPDPDISILKQTKQEYANVWGKTSA